MGLDEESNRVKVYINTSSGKSMLFIDGKEIRNIKNFSISSAPQSPYTEVKVEFISTDAGEYGYMPTQDKSSYGIIEELLDAEYDRILLHILGKSGTVATICGKKVDRNNIRDLVVAAYYFGLGKDFYKDWTT
jgi:hypothetical protein